MDAYPAVEGQVVAVDFAGVILAGLEMLRDSVREDLALA